MHAQGKFKCEKSRETVIGLDIGESSVSASWLKCSSRRGFSLKAGGSVDYAPGDRVTAAVAAIRRLWKDLGLNIYTVCVGIHPDSLHFKSYSYEDLSEDDLCSALHLDAEEAMQLPSDRIAMDVHRYQSNDGLKEGFYIAVPKDAVERCLQILQMTRLFPIIIDVSNMAMANLFTVFNYEALVASPVCLVAVDGHHADIIVMQDSECIYTRSVSAHGKSSQSVAEYLAENVEEVIEHTKVVMSGIQVENVFFSGRSEDADATVKVCHEKTGVEVSFWNPLEKIKISKKLSKVWQRSDYESAALSYSLGLALRRRA